MAKGGGLFEHASGDSSVEQVDELGFPGAGFNQGAIVDNHGQRARELPRNGRGKIVTPPRHKSNFNSPGGSFGNCVPIDGGQVGAFVEQRSINIERNQADWHLYSLPCLHPPWPDPRSTGVFRRQAQKEVKNHCFAGGVTLVGTVAVIVSEGLLSIPLKSTDLT